MLLLLNYMPRLNSTEYFSLQKNRVLHNDRRINFCYNEVMCTDVTGCPFKKKMDPEAGLFWEEMKCL